MALEKYHAKRDFKQTPEPKGKPRASGKKLAFVVQEHHATRLHYDFRLELDGVLKSWAIPKGPSMDPHEHHLAVMTEDHPYEYRKFEGVIPEGNYGAGNVIIWDEGWYEPREETGNQEDVLRREAKKGHITFVLHGKKLHGEFALIKMANAKDDDAWLLVKKGDAFASTNDITKQDESVKSGRTVDEVRGGKKVPDLSAYAKKASPWAVKPMLCTLVDEIFDKEGWLFEIKWDGYRAIGQRHDSDVRLYSRAGTDFMTHYPPVAEAFRALKHDVILDGEIVVTDDAGVPHFEWLQSWRHAPQGRLQYQAFDILWCDGFDVRTMPLIERKALLRAVLPGGSLLRYSDHVETKGMALFAEMQRRGLEGVVAKKADSLYQENNRGSAWLKIKTHLRQEIVIGGYTEPRGGRKYLGSLLAGVYHKGEFVYVGHSGGGIPDDQRKLLFERLQRLERKSSPFATEPKPNAPVHWVRPEVVAEMSFSEWTEDGYMRHPAFVGLRTDKKAINVKREKPKNGVVPVAKTKEHTMPEAKIEFTHLDKVFFPKHKYTKGDIIDYYKTVASVMLPYVKDRPHSMLRQPDGIKGFGFFQKNNEHLPAWVPSADIFSESNNEDLHWIVGGELDTLLYMVQLGTIEINPWNSRVGHLNKPDWIVIDLDPDGARTFKDVVEVAHTVKAVCDEWHIPTYPKTSGKTGIHIFVPMQAKYTYEQAKNLAHLIVLEVNQRQPKITSVERMPDKRRNKIYLDFLQNREGQTLAAPYSVRPTPDASVSAPLHWHEVTPALKPSDFTIKNMPARIKKYGDLWKPVMGKGIDLAKTLKKIGD
ncbi:MAG TPA: DNA ligase D [Candidatus Saccharimonadales bacterium]|nr:DNA ligase D [Candidatus Saccharimonadales bacterium]